MACGACLVICVLRSLLLSFLWRYMFGQEWQLLTMLKQHLTMQLNTELAPAQQDHVRMAVLVLAVVVMMMRMMMY